MRDHELYMTTPEPVIASAPVPISQRLVQVVIVHPEVEQLVPLSALSQRPAPVTHPGFDVTVADTTALVAKAELFAGTVSHELLIVPVKVTIDQLAARSGTTGIRSVSVAREAIVVVLLQVTVVQICALHDHPLSEKALAGPVILVGIMRVATWFPLELILQAFVIVTGI